MTTINLGPDNGTLTLHTGAEGRASRFGHALTLTLTNWRASIDVNAETPTHVEVTVELESLKVTSGKGGVTPITDLDRAAIRRSARKSLDPKRFPTATFESADISSQGSDYTLTGAAEIHGQKKPCTVQVKTSETDNGLHIAGTVTVNQSDFGVKPYSAMLGSLKVSDAVEVRLSCEVPQTDAI